MKSRLLKAVLCTALFIAAIPAFCQQYYVVIGAFAIEGNAKKFTGYARSKYFNAQYAIHKRNKLHHVYILRTSSRDEAVARTLQLQKETEFSDSWVYKGYLGDDATLIKNMIPEVEGDSTSTSDVTFNNEMDNADSVTVAAVDTSSIDPGIPFTPKGKVFKFILITDDGQTLPGEVHAVDRKRGRDLASFKTNEYVDVTPVGKKPMTVVCGIFGYKESEKVIDYNDPSLTSGAHQDSHGAWVVPFRLERLGKGDISVMYRVAFYKDAVVMLPESKKELDELVKMMTDNPNHKVTVHGHCNGNNDRKIIALGAAKNYFDVNGSNEIHGSAKELTKLRADAVKSYLTDNGIDPNRIKTNAWGAEGMLVDEKSSTAKLNDRIEIEIQK